MLIEDAAALARVVDYIPLNPVRARIVPPEQVRHFRWSSLRGIVRGDGWTADGGWRGNGRFGEDQAARQHYEEALIQLGRDEARWESLGLKNLSVGWAIGTAGWRQSLATELRQTAREPGLHLAEVRELRERAWDDAVTSALSALGRTGGDLATHPPRQEWKLSLASEVRRQTGAPWSWLAERLHLGPAGTLRSRLCRQRNATAAQPATA